MWLGANVGITEISPITKTVCGQTTAVRVPDPSAGTRVPGSVSTFVQIVEKNDGEMRVYGKSLR
jgi:hypothetical protein